ncbi:pentapeptide repeat-containing protein [Streptomyces sp. NPDC051578]|uniref:pentapeptide repeat-containing protein n=1 Tax=Streptomyces sp. NPDC051578 TaxID=3365662 RepID=UPI003797DF82
MRLSLPQNQAERRGLRLWHIWLVLPLVFITAIAIGGAAFYAGWDLLGARGLKPEPSLDSKILFDLVKLSLGVVAGAGALVALVVAYRRQRVDEDGALRDSTRLHTERFTTAVSQLGQESAAVRLGGVHALAGLADDAPTRDLRQTCIDVLCAYLRLPYTNQADLEPGDTQGRHDYLAMREVRHTVIRLIRDHLRLEPGHKHSWQGHDFDFTGVVFDGGSFTNAVFSSGTVTFEGATFSGGLVDFDGARFSGSKVNFFHAMFSGGTVDFGNVSFSHGAVTFHGADFAGATVTFDSALFDSGTVDFTHAEFSSGTVTFDGTAFGTTVPFKDTRFSGGAVTFKRALFMGGEVTFEGATFSGAVVDFNDAMFSGSEVNFSTASGEPPAGLVPPSGAPQPTELRLPAAWCPAEP